MTRFPPNVEQITIEHESVVTWLVTRRNDVTLRFPLTNDDCSYLAALLTGRSMPGSSSWRGLLGLGAVSCLIRQALALRAFQRAIGAGVVVATKRDPVVIPEIEFGQIPVQMRFRNVLIHAVNAALENTK